MAAARDRKRKRRRRGRFGFLYKLLSAVLILAALTAAGMVFFRVNAVVVSGNERYTAQQVVEASGVAEGDSLFTLNTFRIALQIRQKLPYVDEVSIRRSLPQTVLISVSESGAAASIESEGTVWLMNYRAKVLEPAGEESAAVAAVTGITPLRPTAGTVLAVTEEEETRLSSLTALLAALKEEGLLEQVGNIDLSYESRITMTYDERYTVKLPMTTDFAKKMRALRQVMESDRIGDRGIIDFTIEEAPHFIPQG